MMNCVLGWNGESSEKPSDIYLGFELPYPVWRPLKADLYIQRLSRLRPRDVVKLLQLLQTHCKNLNLKNPTREILDSPEFISQYSNYYTDQVKSEMMFSFSNDIIKNVFDLVKIINADTISECQFKKIYTRYCVNHVQFAKKFTDHRALLDVLYSLDIIGWSEKSRFKHRNIHWHYREVKAIDETYQLPWERFDCATDAKLVIHKGACKHIVGVAKR